MGLAVSQIRLLALTTRKADIELQMQINSKRKQALTRKSTELSQQYYNKLKNTNIQYATNNGYEDVTFNYLMGQTTGEGYTKNFLTQIKTGSDKNVAQKFVNNMILTDQYGQVVLNDEMAKIVKKTKDSYPVGMSNVERTAQAIVELINERRNDVFGDLFELYASDKVEHKLNSIDSVAKDKLVSYLTMMIENGGFEDGGTVYTPDNGSTFYTNALAAQQGDDSQRVILKKGTVYRVENQNGAVWNNLLGNLYIGGTGVDAFDRSTADGGNGLGLTRDQAKYLGNLAGYFGPMISAALQNGMTSRVEAVLSDGKLVGIGADGLRAEGDSVVRNLKIQDVRNGLTNPSPTQSEINTWLLNNFIPNNKDLCILENDDGTKTYYYNNSGNIESYSAENATTLSHYKTPQVPTIEQLQNDGEWCIFDGKYYKNVGGTISEVSASDCTNMANAVYGGLGITSGDYFSSPSEAALYLTHAGDVGMVKDSSGNVSYYRNEAGNVQLYTPDGGAAGFYSNFTYIVTNNDKYTLASKVETLQSGFKAGTYQLCMVSDVKKGQYHKNTTMEYFTHMQYVVDKADTSMREEVTAWFNTEQAALSEQETYWDSEIQNLSTELTAVNQEIDSVKNLKSNSIKSVFNWGGS